MSEDELAGMGRALSDKTGDAYIHDVTVREKFRGQGLGTLIINMLINRLSKDGITWVGLIAEKNSHPFYKTGGFQIMENSVPMFKWML
jgi:ribosomal protein S18 acetylase RimI-like enzyme